MHGFIVFHHSKFFFKLINWDPATGAPTEQAYKDINLEFVIPVMQKEGLIPGK